jgi:hypothetical protein
MEMVRDSDQTTAEYLAINARKPGGAGTCAYCQGAIDYHSNGEDLVQSSRIPLRYSRQKTEDRAKSYGQVFLKRPTLHPRNGWRTTKECPVLSKGIAMRRIREMNWKSEELEFLCAWAREEKAVNPYSLPAHQQQAAHGAKGVTLIRAIKAWARSEGRKEEEIFDLFADPQPRWPWSSPTEFVVRLNTLETVTS